jgi:hypothetical protein
MKIRNLLLSLSCISSGLLLAQQSNNCGSHIVFEELMQNNAEFKMNQQQLEKETQAFVAQAALQRPSSPTYILPIVFHVIYTTPFGNISDAQIQDQVAILNKEFNRQQPDTILTPAAFKPLAAPFAVEFRLPTIDPNGNCTTGIEHIYSSLANCSYPWDAVKALSDWPSNKYINIWLIENMRYPNMTTCSGGGYSTFPGGAANLDGIVIRSELIGSIGTAMSSSWGNWKGRYLIHELGHWFNLRHIWGDAYCGNDFVADTPPAYFSNSGCPNFPYNANNSCGSNASGEMYTDYMDYTDGTCLNMFSAGQVARMTAAINSPVSGRVNLWSPANLIATGIANPYTYAPNCAAVPEMNIKDMVYRCAGDSVKMISLSYGGTASSRLWNFLGGTPASSTDSIVWVKYSTAGTYPVVLTNNLLSASKTMTFSNRVHIFGTLGSSLTAIPYSQDFESQAGFDNSWQVYDRDQNTVAWELSDTTSYTGGQCIRVNNFGKPAPMTDDFISNTFDLRAIENVSLTFRVAFAAVDAESYDKLVVSASDNCGVSWFTVYQKSVSSLKTTTLNYSYPYAPVAGGTEWRLEKIYLNSNYNDKKVQFKFSFTSGGGNNLYVDDINISGLSTVGIKTQIDEYGFASYPNPVTEDWYFEAGKFSSYPISIEIRDLSGRLMQSQQVTERALEAIKVDTRQLSTGAYIVSVKKDQSILYTSKLMVVR